jgi:phosphopantothenoylcysteine synthetase/decarboxylase
VSKLPLAPEWIVCSCVESGNTAIPHTTLPNHQSNRDLTKVFQSHNPRRREPDVGSKYVPNFLKGDTVNLSGWTDDLFDSARSFLSDETYQGGQMAIEDEDDEYEDEDDEYVDEDDDEDDDFEDDEDDEEDDFDDEEEDADYEDDFDETNNDL